jgi:hypothetical protein
VKAGDLIRDSEFPGECGLLLKICHTPYAQYKYFVLCTDGKARWFKVEEIEGRCEVVVESR